MLSISFYEPTGQVTMTTSVPDDATAARAAEHQGLPFLRGAPSGRNDFYVDVENQVFVPIPPRPSASHQFNWETHEWEDPRTLDDLRASQMRMIDAQFEARAALLIDGYPAAERLTWPMQQAEALAWGENQSTPTPYLDGIAAARGIDPADMRVKALLAVEAFMSSSQALVGTRQRLRDAVSAASTAAEIESVQWPADPP